VSNIRFTPSQIATATADEYTDSPHCRHSTSSLGYTFQSSAPQAVTVVKTRLVLDMRTLGYLLRHIFEISISNSHSLFMVISDKYQVNRLQFGNSLVTNRK